MNADDLGAGVEINEAVFGLMKQGVLTSATLIANGSAVEDAARQVPEYSQCSFGVHLNLTAFRPLTRQPELKPLLDNEGCFSKHALRSTRITTSLRAALLAELSAQVEKLKALGVRISHLDSHHHVHTIPGLFGLLKRLQRRFGIRKVRVSMNLYSAPQPRLLLLEKSLWNAALRHFYPTATTESFTSLTVFAEVAGRLLRPPRSIELMTHPGAPGSEAETQMLQSLQCAQVPFPVEFINYDQL